MVGKLINKLKDCISQIKEHRYKNKQRSLVSYPTTSFAMFHLKDLSLLSHQSNYGARKENLGSLYHVEGVYSDTAQ